ncbi:TonB family protein [Paraglaciecola sp.]|uniref:TonB family protein n=1 Tax=Paraglaciecola sp. TaxID=1920173 RepID=UPI0030F38FAC
MNATLELHDPKPSIFKFAGPILLASIITFALFVMMQKLIANDGEGIIQPLPSPVINITHEFKESPVIERPQPKPMPEPLPRPEKNIKISEPTPDNKDIFAHYRPEIKIQNSGLPNNTQLGLTDGQAIPVVRMEPKYPIDAARAGIEGWVKLLFSIDILGQVQDIQVLDAQPNRIFDREAKRALAKWKYKPQVISGVPQAQQGLMVVLDFKLNQ